MPAPDTASDSNSFHKLPMLPVLLILLLLGVAIFGHRGLLRALQFSRQKASLETQVRDLEKTNAELRREIEALRSDRRTIEGIARRELGMVKEDEIVYQFRSVPKERGAPGEGKTGMVSGTEGE